MPTRPTEVPGDFPPFQPRPLAELCAEAARSDWAQHAGASGELACTVESGPERALALLRIRHARGEALFVALASDQGYALAGQLEALSWDPALQGRGGSTLTRFERRTIAGWPVLRFETAVWRDELGARTDVRHLTVCVQRPAHIDTLGCVLRVPLEARGELNGVTAHVGADATLGEDGVLSLALRRGGWADLFARSHASGDAWLRGTVREPREPPHAPRLPEVLTDPLELPFLFIDQWRLPTARLPSRIAHAEAALDPDAPPAPSDFSADPSGGSLASMCERAVPRMVEPDTGAGCDLFPTSVPGVFLMWAVNMWSEDAFLAVRHPRGYRHVGSVLRGGGESAATRVRAMHRRTLGAAEVLAIETETVYENPELGDPITLGFESRHLTVCTHEPDRVETLRCGARVPLEVRFYELDMREVLTPSPGNYPFVWRELTTGHHEAIAILRPDGTVRVRLRRGSSAALACEEHHNALPIAIDPTAPDAPVPFFAANHRRACP